MAETRSQTWTTRAKSGSGPGSRSGLVQVVSRSERGGFGAWGAGVRVRPAGAGGIRPQRPARRPSRLVRTPGAPGPANASAGPPGRWWVTGGTRTTGDPRLTARLLWVFRTACPRPKPGTPQFGSLGGPFRPKLWSRARTAAGAIPPLGAGRATGAGDVSCPQGDRPVGPATAGRRGSVYPPGRRPSKTRERKTSGPRPAGIRHGLLKAGL